MRNRESCARTSSTRSSELFAHYERDGGVAEIPSHTSFERIGLALSSKTALVLVRPIVSHGSSLGTLYLESDIEN